jgi:hypothetical protein
VLCDASGLWGEWRGAGQPLLRGKKRAKNSRENSRHEHTNARAVWTEEQLQWRGRILLIDAGVLDLPNIAFSLHALEV